MKKNTVWICEKCEDKAHYKGLCKKCTEYSSEGDIISPVARVRFNKDGSKWKPPKRGDRMPTTDVLQFMKNSRRKKPTKKQIERRNEELKALAEIEIPHDEGEFVELGESVEEEE